MHSNIVEDLETLRRWLQDTSKRQIADILIFFSPPPFLFPRVHPRLTRRWIKPSKRSG